MGMQYATYHFYGVHVPRDRFQTDHVYRETEWLDGILKHTPGLSGKGLGHVSAGDYDCDELFLCIVPKGESCEVPLGKFGKVTPESYRPEWDKLLQQLAEAAGYGHLGQPGYIVVPDLS